MTLALFPEIAPPAVAPCSLDTQAISPPENDSDPAPLPAPAPGRGPRLRLPDPALGRRRRTSPADVELHARGNLERDTLKAAAIDAIRGFLGSIAVGDPLPVEFEVTEADRRWLERVAALMSECQSVRAFREAMCGRYLARSLSCHSRVCPDDERARSTRLVDRYRVVLDAVPRRRRSMVVVTVRNMARLAAGLDLLSRSVASLRRRPLMAGGRCRWRERDGSPGHPCAHPEHPRSRALDKLGNPNAKGRNCPDYRHRPVAGGVTAVEVTYNADARSWHPHANLLMDAPFIAQAELADTWRAITCDDSRHRRAGCCPSDCDRGSPVVHIEQVHAETVREALKYVTKSAELVAGDDPLPMIEFLLATRGRRLVQGWGSFYGLTFEEPDELTVTVRIPADRFVRFELPRYCPFCGRDTQLGDDPEQNTWEPPVIAPRRAVRLHSGAPSWTPAP